ncbi:MAG: zf-HC2 domain-containing protein [Eubacteriales bacterium]|nr:zf-HC2 domain-containing protein [Eubacteriales bacterium]
MDCRTAQQKIMPYIERKLNDREMEAFIEHIRECETCSEELEVYFTIYYAIEKLDDKGQDSFDMKELLEKDLERAEHKISNRYILKFYQRLFIALMAILMSVIVFTGIQIALRGSFEDTTLYNLFSNQSEEEYLTVPEKETEQSETEEKRQQETNRKNQVIVTTPETEKWIRETLDME